MLHAPPSSVGALYNIAPVFYYVLYACDDRGIIIALFVG